MYKVSPYQKPQQANNYVSSIGNGETIVQGIVNLVDNQTKIQNEAENKFDELEKKLEEGTKNIEQAKQKVAKLDEEIVKADKKLFEATDEKEELRKKAESFRISNIFSSLGPMGQAFFV